MSLTNRKTAQSAEHKPLLSAPALRVWETTHVISKVSKGPHALLEPRAGEA